ncbi:MAG: formyltransferase family protein [Mangrovibacterium sp.]|nr:formyltransferase family protein [Mangrovibacterium sp.]
MYTKRVNEGSQWGALYVPANAKAGSGEGLRIVVFGSTNGGALVIGSLLRFERKNHGLINLVGVATDDPVDPDTKISVGKRIWRHYREEEMIALRDKVIGVSTDGGVACYTGGVKTACFREILKQWNPDVIIMCCFGQKVDPFIFNYPAYGMYNFHPSDLAAHIGEGAQPFRDTLSNGHTTSVMTVHVVNEWIDRGPIVGRSPRISIVKADGAYPESILSLQEKIPSICGWLAIELILEVLKKRQAGIAGAVGAIDFDERIPEPIKRQLMGPANDDLTDGYTLPLHDLIR